MSFEKDITEIKKLVEEVYSKEVETMPAESPVITPELPTQKPKKPTTPIRPTPGVTPKPKAFSPDVELFLRKRNINIPEAIQEQEAEPLAMVHPQKKEWIQTGDEKINQILPELSDKQQKYLTTIASESYAETVDRIEKYTGLEVTKENIPALVSLLMESLEEVTKIEKKNKPRLEDLAMELVFSVPEFKIVEQAYMNDEITIDAKIDTPHLQRLIDTEAPVDGLSQDEELNMKMAEFFKDNDQEELRRKFANLMITGGSINKLYLFHMAADKLNVINPELAKYYGVLSSVAQLGYWVTPFGIEEVAAAGGATSAGSEEVIPQGDKYVIKARGTTFPYLVHELVKGFYEWISIDPNLSGTMSKEKVEDETQDVMAGPGIYKAVVSYVPSGKHELLPIIQKKLVAMGPAEIRDVIGKTERGREIMAGVIADAEREWDEYKASKEKYEEGE